MIILGSHPSTHLQNYPLPLLWACIYTISRSLHSATQLRMTSVPGSHPLSPPRHLQQPCLVGSLCVCPCRLLLWHHLILSRGPMGHVMTQCLGPSWVHTVTLLFLSCWDHRTSMRLHIALYPSLITREKEIIHA